MSLTFSGAATAPGVDATRPVSIVLRAPATAVDDVGAALDAVASDLRSLWSSAFERGHFNEITRLVEASHAVHRAIVALKADGVIAAWSASP